MPTIHRRDIDALHIILSVQITKSEYYERVKSKLKEVQRTIKIKGFRQGTVPAELVVSRYGTSMMTEELNDMVAEALKNYLDKEALNIIGRALPLRSEQTLDFKSGQDYTFEYEIGLTPEFEFQGIDKHVVLTRYKTIAEPTLLQKNVDDLLKRAGSYVENLESIELNDTIYVRLQELDEEGNLKGDGLIVDETVVSVKLIKSEELQDKIMTLRPGDCLDVNVFELEKVGHQEIRKYMLNIGDDNLETGDHFRLTLLRINRWVPAELNEAFFQKNFSEGDVTDEQGLRDLISADITSDFDNSSMIILRNSMFDIFKEHGKNIPLPDEFLQRYLLKTSKSWTLDEVIVYYPQYANSIRWELTSSKVARENEIKIYREEIFDVMRHRVMRQLGISNDTPWIRDYVNSYANKLMENQKLVEEAAELIMERKVLDWGVAQCTVQDQEITMQEFSEIISQYNSDYKAKRDGVLNKQALLEEFVTEQN